MNQHLLDKELGLWDVYALATGATLSSGLFLLPGIAAASAGPAMPLSYLLGALIVLPGLASKVELATAMPRSGGIYFFLDRSMGPLVGMIGGFGTWIALMLKSAFALIGISAYLMLFAPELPTGLIAACFAVAFGVVNHFGAKKSGSFQIVLLIGLLTLLAWFCGLGVLEIEIGHFRGYFRSGAGGLISTAGLVVVSYMGLTKVTSVAEEVKDPERNLPLGMFLAFATIVAIYVLGTAIMVGVVGVERLAAGGGDLTPVATVGDALVGKWGATIMTVAAVLAFSSVANAGILGASRYPLAMGRDSMLPPWFSKIGRRGTPTNGIAVTVALMLVSVVLFDPTKIAKLASAFQMTMFALACLAVIVMRESRIASYDPGFRSPFYPTVHLLGIVGPAWLIVEMGLLPTLFTLGLILSATAWYVYYARSRVVREGAVFHIFERLARQNLRAPEQELPEVHAAWSPSDEASLGELLESAQVIDLEGPIAFTDLAHEASRQLAINLPVPARAIAGRFIESTRAGATAIARGAALSHIRLEAMERAHMVMARVREGVHLTSAPDDKLSSTTNGPESASAQTGLTRAVFFLVSPQNNPALHLRALAMMARRVDQDSFANDWMGAVGEEELKHALLRPEQRVHITVGTQGESARLEGLRVEGLPLPGDTRISTIQRDDEMIVPRATTRLRCGDVLTIVGGADEIRTLEERYGRAHR